MRVWFREISALDHQFLINKDYHETTLVVTTYLDKFKYGQVNIQFETEQDMDLAFHELDESDCESFYYSIIAQQN